MGICGAEERLQSQIVDMLKHISIIDECDNLSQDMDGKKYVHDVSYDLSFSSSILL